MGDTEDALRWLGSPVTAGALAVLVVNDHVLKQAWPGLVTGKLSDVAGLVVAPPLVALLLALVRVRWSALLVTGAGFAVVKTVPAAAAVTSAGLGWLAGPSYVRADLTDLLALPALLLAHHARRTSTVTTSPRRWLVLGALLLPFAVVATAATSPVLRAPGRLLGRGVHRGLGRLAPREHPRGGAERGGHRWRHPRRGRARQSEPARARGPRPADRGRELPDPRLHE